MRCLNCDRNALPINTEICPKCNAHLPSLMRDLLPNGKLLNRNKYRIDYPLGRGGFGVTYRGIHTDLQQPVAIKEFYPIEQASRYGETTQLIVPKDKEELFDRGIKRFLKEAKILNAIEHPNIVRVRDYFAENNTAYIVMSLVSGTTLSSLLKAQPNSRLSPEKVKEIIAVLVEALATIHAASIYHLDIKPDNILITENGKIVLVDFGASKQGMGSHSTQAFTLSYAPPEVIGAGKVGAHSDIFELGVMMYEMLTGKQPPNAVDRLVKDDFSAKDLPQPWQSLVNSALKLSEKERPSQIKKWWANSFNRVDFNRDLAAINPSESKTVAVADDKKVSNSSTAIKLPTTGLKYAGILLAGMALAVIGTKILASFDSIQASNSDEIVAKENPPKDEVKTKKNPVKEAKKYYQLGKDYKEQKEWDLAIENYTKAIAIDPNYALAYNNRGNVYLKQKKYDLALKDINKAIEIDPNLASAYNNRGNVYHNQKKLVLALENYTKALEIDPNYILAYISRGNVYNQQKKYDLALKDFNKAIEIDPNYILAHISRGIVYQEQKKYDLALKDFNKALELDPNYILAHISRGNVYYGQEKWDLAIKNYTKALEIDPNYILAYNGRGSVYEEEKKYDLALKDFNKAIELDPNDDVAYHGRANVYNQQKKWDLAIKNYTKAIELDPNDTDAYHGRANVYYYGQNKLELAIIDYNKAIELDPNDAPAYYSRGNVYKEQKKYNLAIIDYNKAIELEPNYSHAYNGRGIVYKEQKKYNLAIIDYNKAIELDPNDAVAYNNRGLLYGDRNKWNLAFADFNKMIEINPNDGKGYVLRGMVWIELKEKQKGFDALETAAELYKRQGDMDNYQSILDTIRWYKKYLG